ncbi:hypothetical protein DFJ74DRAFT_654636 [Hyaloraphidium curvatum]|nr:hypothetical protein DFJ74DRAFT_654636 [Hyaloraphidium curvatum]
MGFCAALGKTALAIFSLLILAIGVICIAIGAYGFAQGLYKESTTALAVFASLIALGVICLITAIVGFVGICQNNTAALNCYIVFVVICLVLSAALAGFFTWAYVAYKNDPRGLLQQAWNNTPADTRQQFEKTNNCLGFDDTPTTQGCGDILVDIYNRFSTIALIVIWVVFAVILILLIITCLVKNDIIDDMNRRARAPQTVYMEDPAVKA